MRETLGVSGARQIVPGMVELGTMSVIVKICGLKTPEALDVALDAGADMVGFVFFPPSPRHVAAMETARALGVRANGRAKKVPLNFVIAEEWVDEVAFGDLLPGAAEATAAKVAAAKALAVETQADLAGIAPYTKVADWLLFDARAPKDATRPGGLGKPFDWHLLENLDLALPYMLSGGLTPDNVAQALRVTHAPAVDVSSGVERAPGEKDADKIRAFIRAAREAATTMMSNA